MDIIFNFFLIFHIAGGSVGLLSGFSNIFRKKGGKNHVLVGKVFFVSMLTAGFSSLVLSILHPNYFLFMVGVFTLYMVSSGQHYLKRKGKPVSRLGWAITILMLLVGILFVGIGVLALVQSNFFGIVYVAFGGVGFMFVRQDLKNNTGKSSTKNYWLVAHLQRMTGAFIAALTAFIVVNANYFPEQIPGFVFWLLPTIVLTPLIVRWSGKYEIKKK